MALLDELRARLGPAFAAVADAPTLPQGLLPSQPPPQGLLAAGPGGARPGAVAPRQRAGALMADDGANVLEQIFAGRDDPRLSAEQNANARRDAIFTAGLETILASQSGRFGESIARGALAGQAAGVAGRARIMSETRVMAINANRRAFASRINEAGSLLSITPDALSSVFAEAQLLGDTETMEVILPFIQRAATQQQNVEAAQAEQRGVALFQQAVAAINSGQSTEDQAIAILEASARSGDLASVNALKALRGDDDVRSIRRDRIRDDFQDEGERLNVRARAVKDGLTGNPPDLSLIAAVVRAETGDSSVSSKTVVQFSEQGTLPAFIQSVIDNLKTSELTDDIRKQMRERLKFLGGQVAVETSGFEQRLIATANAEGILVSDLGVKLPSELLPASSALVARRTPSEEIAVDLGAFDAAFE